MGVILRGYRKEDGSTVEVAADSLGSGGSGGSEADLIEDIHYIGSAGEPGWENGWRNYNPAAFVSAGFYKDRDRVFLTGLIDGGAPSNSAFTLPAGYRPVLTMTFGGNDTDYIWLVNATGIVVPKLRNSPFGWSLEVVSFRVA